MNAVFWGGLVVMLLVAIAIMVWPLLRPRVVDAPAYRDSNLGLYQDKLRELDQDLAEGRIEQSFYDHARQELDRELLTDIPAEAEAEVAGSMAGKHPALALFIAAVIPAASLLMYMELGMHAQSESFQQQQVAQQTAPQGEGGSLSMDKMVAVLEQRIATQGGDAEAWSMLGRGYKFLQRFSDAASAFRVALEMQPSAQLMLETAEAIALSNQQRFDEEARKLVLSALSMEPNNINALWFAGVAEFQFEEYWQSVDHLSAMAQLAPQETELMNSVSFYLNQIKILLTQKGEDVSPIDETLQLIAQHSEPVKPEPEVAVRSIVVSVEVDAAIRQQYSDNDAVFVYARAQQGPKMPLAVQRLSLADLPANVGLDDSMAMVEGMNLSSFDQLEVFARISPSGTAVTQSGDALGQFALNEVSNNNEVSIIIDRRVP